MISRTFEGTWRCDVKYGERRGNKLMSRRNLRIHLLVFFAFCTGSPSFGQSTKIPLFTDVNDYRRALADVPKADSIESDLTLFEAHLNRGLGAEFNSPMSLTAVFCDRKTARLAIEDALSSVLKDELFDMLAGWDNFGYLTAKKKGHALIFKTPPRYEQITLRIKIDQGDVNERAITIDYVVQASPRANDPESWTDESANPIARDFVDDLRGKMRDAAEVALRNNCKRVTAKGIKSSEDGISALARGSQLSSSQLQAVKTAVTKPDE